MDVGLIETMRVRGGGVPWLDRHLARLRASMAARGVRAPADDVADLVRLAVGAGERRDRVVRLQLIAGHVEITSRDVNPDRDVTVIVSQEIHAPYPHKTTQREQFGRAFAHARRGGAQDALLLTAGGAVAEGTAWNLFWWENGELHTPAEDLGILPGVGRRRIMELANAKEAQVPAAALAGRSLFLVNAVRGVVEIGALDGAAVPRDPRTAELAAAFWPTPG